MVQGIIAVEEALSNVIDLLETEGYEVVPLDYDNTDAVDAIIVSGADINLMNIQDTLTEVRLYQPPEKARVKYWRNWGNSDIKERA